MMGGHHAITGAAGGIAIAGTSALAFGLIDGITTAEVVAVAFMTAGAALLPDIDHHSGTIARSLPDVGPLPSPSEVLCRVVGRISGGHRRGTHSVLGIAVFVLVTVALGRLVVPTGGTDVALGAGLLGVLLASFALRAFRLTDRGRVWPWVFALGAGVFFGWQFPDSGWVLPVSVGLGCAIHILGDMLTTGGVPLLWPVVVRPPQWFRRIPAVSAVWKRNGFLAVPVLGDTGSAREWVLCSAVTIYVAAAFVAEFGWLPDSAAVG